MSKDVVLLVVNSCTMTMVICVSIGAGIAWGEWNHLADVGMGMAVMLGVSTAARDVFGAGR